jgi:hypothetical protein
VNPEGLAAQWDERKLADVISANARTPQHWIMERNTMASVNVSIEIAAPVEAVWAMLGDFDGLPTWLEFVRSSRLTDGGRMRHLEAIDGAIIVEELLEHSAPDMFYRYSIVGGPDPVTNYVATIRAQRLDSRMTNVTWASRFEPLDAQKAASLVGHYEVLYRAGLDRLKTLAEAQAPAN